MTYGCVAHRDRMQDLDDAAISHLAELVRGDFSDGEDGPLIRPFGHLLPKGRRAAAPLE